MSVCDHIVVDEREEGGCLGGGGEVVAVVPVEYLAPVFSLSRQINNEHRHTCKRAKCIRKIRGKFHKYGALLCKQIINIIDLIICFQWWIIVYIRTKI